MKNNKRLLAVLSVLLLSCSTSIPNTKVCVVAGSAINGADCAYTLTDEIDAMTFEEFMEFLEPQDTHQAPDGHIVVAKAGALCQSASDWNAQKTALEELCRKYKGACSYQVQTAVKRVNQLVEISEKKGK